MALLQHQVLAAEQKVVALEERTEKDWIVAPEEVEVDMAAEIGCGSFGVVRPGQFEGMEVAVKCVKVRFDYKRVGLNLNFIGRF